MTVIEEVAIEDYLLGVLPFEMEPNWPIEALKAQAVVARTFAYTQLGKYRKDGYDLSTDTRSQVYGGRTDRSASIKEAVDSTRGEVLGARVRSSTSTITPAAAATPPTPRPFKAARLPRRCRACGTAIVEILRCAPGRLFFSYEQILKACKAQAYRRSA